MSSEFINFDTSTGLAGTVAGPPLVASNTVNSAANQPFKQLYKQEIQQSVELQNTNVSPRLDAGDISVLNSENSTLRSVPSVTPLDAIEPIRGSMLPPKGKNEDQLLSSPEVAQNVFTPLWVEPKVENTPELLDNSLRVQTVETTEDATIILADASDASAAIVSTAQLSAAQLVAVDTDAADLIKKPSLSNASLLERQVDSPLLQSRDTLQPGTLTRLVPPLAANNEHNLVNELTGINIDHNRPANYVDSDKLKNEPVSVNDKQALFRLGQQYTNADFAKPINLAVDSRGNGVDLSNLFEEKSSNLLNFDFKPEAAVNRPIFELPVGLNPQLQTNTDSIIPKSFYQLVGQTTDSRWGEELGTKLQMLIQNNIQQAQFHINPKNLGPLDVFITVNQDQQVSIGFNVQQGALKEALDAALPRLREMLQEQGLNLNNVDIGQRNPSKGKQTPAQYRNLEAIEEETIVTSASIPESTRSLRVGLSSVDLFA